jgi:hypothetical protein
MIVLIPPQSSQNLNWKLKSRFMLAAPDDDAAVDVLLVRLFRLLRLEAY